MPDDKHLDYGAPSTVWLQVDIQASSSTADSTGVSINFDFQWFNKTATRLAEASWVSFAPDVGHPDSGWQLRGFRTGNGTEMMPGADAGIDPTKVVTHGAVHLHSLGPLATVEYHDAQMSVVIAGLDTPIVSAGILSPFPTPSSNASIGENLRTGMHWNLQNNIWNTNFPQWFPFVPEDANGRFRFKMDIDEH